jgi:hypothetical protein
VSCTARLAVSEPIMTSRRGSRSATTPPASSAEICANVRAAKTIPTSVAEPVRSSTANASAIGTRFVPKNETVLAEKRSAKFRRRSGPMSAVCRSAVGASRHGRDAVLPSGDLRDRARGALVHAASAPARGGQPAAAAALVPELDPSERSEIESPLPV